MPPLEELFAGLVNKNPKPKKVNILGEHFPLFAEDFDWKENARVFSALQQLDKSSAEEAWPLLNKHLADAGYCLSVNRAEQVDIASFTNISVHELCWDVARRDLTYVLRITPPEPNRRNRLQFDEWENNWRPVLRFRNKEWWDQNRGKKLYELQIELLEWLITEAPGPATLSEEDRKVLVSKARAEIDDLRKARQGKVAESRFTDRHRSIFDKKAADRIRERYQRFGSD